jgi:hypothetical protein
MPANSVNTPGTQPRDQNSGTDDERADPGQPRAKRAEQPHRQQRYAYPPEDEENATEQERVKVLGEHPGCSPFTRGPNPTNRWFAENAHVREGAPAGVWETSGHLVLSRKVGQIVEAAFVYVDHYLDGRPRIGHCGVS